jgi:hypothetical protein
MTSGQRPKAVKTLLAPPRGLPCNRLKSGQASRFAVERQPVYPKRHAEIGCAWPKWWKQRSFKTFWTSSTTWPVITSISGRSKWSNLSLDDGRKRRTRWSPFGHHWFKSCLPTDQKLWLIHVSLTGLINKKNQSDSHMAFAYWFYFYFSHDDSLFIYKVIYILDAWWEVLYGVKRNWIVGKTAQIRTLLNDLKLVLY